MITISISSYNQEEFLADAIESAINQTIPCEVIVVDDGSTDHSLEIAKKYPVKVISQVNKGLASARNTGLMNSTGEYFLPLDADDILLPHCAETLLAIAKSTHADIVSPSFKCFGMGQETVILMPNPTIADFRMANRVGYCSLIKKDSLLEIGGYSPRMTWGWEDYHLWFNLLLRNNKLLTTSDVLWLYRTKEKSMWTDSREHSEELFAQIKKDFPTIW